MKLFECLELANACGLDTIGEAYVNVDYHSGQLFVYDAINKEIEELRNEYKKYCLFDNQQQIKNMTLQQALDILNFCNGTDWKFRRF